MLSQPVPVGRDRLAVATRSTRLIFLVSGIGMAAWAPMVPYAKARLGLDDAQLGLMLLAFGGGSMASMPFVGWLSHRFGNRRVIVASGWLLCLALPVLALAPNVAVLTAALLYFGVMLGAVDVAMNAHAVEVERRDGRVLMSGFHGLFSLGGLAGAAGMSALLALGLPLPLAALAVSALLAALVLYLRGGLLPNVDGAAAGHAPFRMPHGAVLLLGLLCFVSFMAEGSMLDWSAVFLRDFRGFAPSAAGIGYACFSVAMALGRLTGDRHRGGHHARLCGPAQRAGADRFHLPAGQPAAGAGRGGGVAAAGGRLRKDRAAMNGKHEMIDTVVFDLGGVLIDWNPRYLYRRLFDDEAAMERFLAEVCTGAWNEQQDAGRPWHEAVASLTAQFPEHAGLIAAYRDGRREMLGGVIQGSVDLLAELKARGVRLYALTNWSHETFPHAKEIEMFGFLHWFEGIVVSGEERLIKPDPRIYRRLFERYAIDPARTAYIDDARRNVDAAAAQGMHAWWFRGPEGLREWLATHGLVAA